MRSAAAMVGTAVFRMVVSSDSMKNETATSHGTSRFTEGGTIGDAGAGGGTAQSNAVVAPAPTNTRSGGRRVRVLASLAARRAHGPQGGAKAPPPPGRSATMTSSFTS